MAKQSSELTDAELVRKARHGDVASFHELVDRCAPELYGLALKLCKTAADAEDVLQETFIGAYLGLKKFKGESSVKTWLKKILARQAARLYRRPAEVSLKELDQEPATPPFVQAVDLRMDVEAAIQWLPPELRQVIVLKAMEGFTYDEIAELLGISQVTVARRLQRAREILEVRLAAYLPPSADKSHGANE